MEVPPETLLVSVRRDTNDHRIAVLPLGEERECGPLAPQLVLGVVEVGEILDLWDRQSAVERTTEREPEHGLLVEVGVEDPVRPEPFLETAGHAVDAAFESDVLAEDDRVVGCLELVGQSAVDGLGQGQALGVAGVSAVAPGGPPAPAPGGPPAAAP